MDIPVIVNLVLNFFIFAIFGAGLGLGNAHLDPTFRLYNIYAYSLFAVPIILYFFRKYVKWAFIKKLLIFLSFTYFIWGYVIMDFVQKPLEPLYNYDKYYYLKNVNVVVNKIEDKGIIDSKRYFNVVLNVVNNTKKTFEAQMTLTDNLGQYFETAGCNGNYRSFYNKIQPGKNTITYECFFWVFENTGKNINVSLSELGGSVVLQNQPKTEIYFSFIK